MAAIKIEFSRRDEWATKGGGQYEGSRGSCKKLGKCLNQAKLKANRMLLTVAVVAIGLMNVPSEPSRN